MSRIFAPLAIATIIILFGAIALGFHLRNYEIARVDPVDLDGRQWGTVHRVAGIGAGVVVVLVNSIVVTYFIGVTRWFREVRDAYSLPPEWSADAQRLKRRAFPWSALGMLLAVALVASGGAADPGASLKPPATTSGFGWPEIHLCAAIGFVGFFVLSCVIQWRYLEANQRLIQRVMDEVARIRKAKNLDS